VWNEALVTGLRVRFLLYLLDVRIGVRADLLGLRDGEYLLVAVEPIVGAVALVPGTLSIINTN